MSIRLDAYRIFCEVALCKSISKAAQKLYMTQPAVSQSIAQLEEELGIRLFTRGARGVTLTTEGEMLFEHVYVAINRIELGEQRIKESRNLQRGELKIGVSDAVSKYYLLPYLEAFHQRYPAIKLKIINRTTPEQCELLKSGEIDLALCNLPIKDSALEIREYFYVHDIFVGGEAYKKLSKNPIAMETLNELPLIFLESKSNSRQYVEKYMASKGMKISPEIELGSHELLLAFAKINLGVSCVVKEFSKDYLEQEGLYEIRLMQPIPRRSIGCCFLKSVSLSPVATQFLSILEEKN